MSKMLKKQPNESFIYTLIFEKNMERDETITAINSLTSAPSGLTVGSPEAPVISGKKIQFRISGGTNGSAYQVTARVTTSLGNVLEFDLNMITVEDI